VFWELKPHNGFSHRALKQPQIAQPRQSAAVFILAQSTSACSGSFSVARLVSSRNELPLAQTSKDQRGKIHLMKTKCFFVGTVALLALLASAWAADVAGKWVAQAQGADITITFKVDGNTLTGTVDNSQAGPTDIKDGKMDGDSISFHVVRKMGESEIKIMWQGKVAGDEINFKREVQGGGAGAPGGGAEEIIAKRAK
jgi:hypothetical protein